MEIAAGALLAAGASIAGAVIGAVAVIFRPRPREADEAALVPWTGHDRPSKVRRLDSMLDVFGGYQARSEDHHRSQARSEDHHAHRQLTRQERMEDRSEDHHPHRPRSEDHHAHRQQQQQQQQQHPHRQLTPQEHVEASGKKMEAKMAALRSDNRAVAHAEACLASEIAAHRSFGPEIATAKEDLEMCRAAVQRSCAVLRDGLWSNPEEAEQHITALGLLGRRMSLDRRVFEALPGACGPSRHPRSRAFVEVLTLVERSLREKGADLESKLAQLASAASAGLREVREAEAAAEAAKDRQLASHEAVRNAAEAHRRLEATFSMGFESSSSRNGGRKKLPALADSNASKDWRAPAGRQNSSLMAALEDQSWDRPGTGTSTALVLQESMTSCASSSKSRLPAGFEAPPLVAFWEDDELESAGDSQHNEEPLEEALWSALHTSDTDEQPAGRARGGGRLKRALSQESAPGLPLPESLASGSRITAKNSNVDSEEPRSAAELAVLALLEYGDEKGLAVIKGLKPEDVKKILVHRSAIGPVSKLADLPRMLGRKLSIKKFLSDNAV
ncbi:unnamed protein product [Polarella glacialis]|uniref:Uncharacterized protein n=1 Tax=Polarella glacialis TaxID=89957 RepID=A0A813HQV3_POLGL|nr:unnamed protein product [Polarella glacialis]